MWWLVSLALASDPTVRVEPDGTVVATVTLAAPEERVRAVLADGVGTSRLSPELLSVSTTKEGACEVMSKKTRGMLSPFHLRTRRCPTASGWSEILVESDDFRSFASTFELAPAPGGTLVTYRVRTELAMPVPGGMLQRALADASSTVLANLSAKVATPR